MHEDVGATGLLVAVRAKGFVVGSFCAGPVDGIEGEKLLTDGGRIGEVDN